jgi:hypothetical protein
MEERLEKIILVQLRENSHAFFEPEESVSCPQIIVTSL